MRVILARHGETAWNVEGRYQGRGHDIPLSEAGHSQARAMGYRLLSQEFARVVSSPLLRASQTAEMALGKQAEGLVLEPSLMEMDYGSWEGRLHSEVCETDGELLKTWRETPHRVKFPGGESFQDVLDRAWPAFCRACEGLGDEETVFMVSHDGVNRALLCRILGLSVERIWSFGQAPTCMNLLEGPTPESMSVVRLNDASHLARFFGEPTHRRL
jgi:phosphoserine phosphatase